MPARDAAVIADALLPAVLEAARLQLALRAGGLSVEHKEDRSPVTLADRRSEEILAAALAAAAPGIPVIAEEAASEGRLPGAASELFLVDPLDGTREYVAGGAEFTINVALVRDGVPVFGIIYAPALEALYATVGPGQAVGGRLAPDTSASTIADTGARPIRARAADPAAVVALVSRTHVGAATEAYLARFALAARHGQSSSIKFCRIAAGEADIYPRLGDTSEWDTAAGHAILVAAGGHVTCLDGSPLLYGLATRGYVNPAFVAWGRGALPVRG